MKKSVIALLLCSSLNTWSDTLGLDEIFVQCLMRAYAMAPENTDCLTDEKEPDFQPRFRTADDLYNLAFPTNIPFANWSLSYRRSVMENWLRRIADKDPSQITSEQDRLAGEVITFYNVESITNCTEAIRRLGIRTTKLAHEGAYQYIFTYDIPSIEMNEFVVVYATNRVSHGESSRHEYAGGYLGKLLQNTVLPGVRQDAAARFYPTRAQHHLYYELDPLLVATWPDYATSTNRLHFAEEALTSPEVDGYWATYFESVTNQLHQAGL